MVANDQMSDSGLITMGLDFNEGFHESYLLCSKMPKEAKGGPTDDFSSCNRDQGNGGQRLPEQVVGGHADGLGIVHEGC